LAKISWGKVMAVAETSKIAYHSLKRLGDMQAKVHEAVGEMGIASDRDILEYLQRTYPADNWEMSKVNGRRNELMKYGYIECHGQKMGSAGTPVKTWHCVNPNDRKLKEMASE